MNENFSVVKLSPEHRIPVIDIFNYYIENSFAAFPENKMGYEFFDMIMKVSAGYPAAALLKDDGTVVGFGFLHAHNQMPVFKHTAEISYFIADEYTGNGLGRLLLHYLLQGAEEKGIKVILASISSPNENSLKFHKNNHFKECGRFVEVGFKKNTSFDVVWMERFI